MVRTLLMSLAIMKISCSYGWVQPSSGILSSVKQQRSSTTQLQVSFSPGALGEEYHHHYVSQEEAKKIMDRANECAHSDSCSVEDAMMYLQDVVHIQSDCVTGTLVGKDLCENQDVVADVVANLREKIGSTSSTITTGATSIAQQAHQRALDQGSRNTAGFALLASGLFFVAMAVSTGLMQQPQQMDTVPFTMQEWWWSIRDGYFPSMIEYNFRHGGLVVDIENYFNNNEMLNSVIMPFTLQEWWWSIRDGYLGTMLEDNFRNGGFLVSSADTLNSGVVSPTPQEWMWAVKDGYADTMFQHVLRNGGLASTADAATTEFPFAPREWIWAMQGGYFDTMMDHFIRNGGV